MSTVSLTTVSLNSKINRNQATWINLYWNLRYQILFTEIVNSDLQKRVEVHSSYIHFHIDFCSYTCSHTAFFCLKNYIKESGTLGLKPPIANFKRKSNKWDVNE